MADRLSAMQWFDDLHSAITSARVKAGGVDHALETGLEKTAGLIRSVRQRDGSAFWVGNGGSAAICSHLAQDMLNKLEMKSLFCGDIAMMTCMANDFGYENGYARPLGHLGREGDLLIAISSSGNSANIGNAVDLALSRKMDVITLSGFGRDNRLWNSAGTVNFWVQSQLYGIVEMAHEAILHGVIETAWLEEQNKNTDD